MKIKVLHVINSMQPGGAEVMLTNSLSPGGLCEHTENHLAYFMAPSYLLNNLDKNVKVHFLDYRGAKDIFRLIYRLKKIIRENKIDIVHSHLNPAGVYAHFACPKNIPQVHTVHTTYSMDNSQSKFKSWLEKYFYLTNKNTNVILLSDFTKADFLNTVSFKGRAFVLNNFVPDFFFDVQTDKQQQPFRQLKLIALGTLQPLKNFEYLLQVFSYLKDYPVSLDIFGRGDKAPYEAAIKKNGVKVKMMGHTENLKDIIAGYDMFIMPSKYEGFPLSVFEAMATGVPLMLSNIAPLTAIVKNNAIYFELDDAAKTAQQILAVLKNEIDIAAMAVKAKQYADKTVRREIYIKNLLDIYKQTLQ